ncbi:YqhG family protein [Texcoconibacillus texcoconensis]|uniref:Uncharacterized protein n=1 Tax=Texcoconibacillus texcoconensis TaxID=1095777 RepID=A0A840QP04_9BACI|nr:YqhG family protein [Texcoconibacillus texcoconensis]MBB5173100.1 hypothetical protein [Texcoconibacillus texcoconensis]
MHQEDIHQFLKTFFTSNDCTILSDQEGVLGVQLTVDMDKVLMNRPFYWHYLEKIGGIPNPMQLWLKTDPESDCQEPKAESIHFGSPRLQQIFRACREQGRFANMYEKCQPQAAAIPLHPWLVVNLKAAYRSHVHKDERYSIGLNLANGEMIDNFHQLLRKRPLSGTIADYCFTVSPIIKPESGFERIRHWVEENIKSKDHSWADEAYQLWKQHLDLLHTFYEKDQNDLDNERYEKEKQALKEQFEPRIQVDVINGGLFYLKPGS